jgi:hypothetical protein
MAMERMQILVTQEQRRRLKQAAAGRGTSVTELVRQAIDAELAAVSPARERKLRALAELRAMPPVEFIAPEELRELIDQQFDEEIDPHRLRGEA